MAVLRIHAPVLGQQERVLELPDGRTLTVGRDETCDVVLLEQAASRLHAILVRHGDEIRVTDCDSANGVWVGDERVTGSRVLHDGEVVRIGDTTLALAVDPHRQLTVHRVPGEEKPVIADVATPARDDVAAGPTLIASSVSIEAPASSPPATVEAPASTPPATVEAPVAPALVAPRGPVPVLAASSASAYSFGSGPTLASDSGPDHLGAHEPSSPSTYSLGSGPRLASDSGPDHLGAHEPSSPSTYSLGSGAPLASESGPNRLGVHETSAPSLYSIGEAPTLAPHVEPSGGPLVSSGSVYSLGREPAAAREPDSFGSQLPSSGSVYSLGHEPAAAREPDSFGSQLPSSGSVYSLGREPMAAFRGPDIRPPAPSAQLQPAPPRPSVTPPAPSPPPPAYVDSRRPPAFVVPPKARSAASSWGEWAEPMPSEQRERGRAAGPALWLGLGLLIGGIAAMVVAVVAGYDPSELVSSIRAAVDPGGAR